MPSTMRAFHHSTLEETMGYNQRPGVAEKHKDTLEQIKVCIDQGIAAQFTASHPAHLPRLRDKLHWILRCAKTFKDEVGGKYAALRDQVQVSVDWDNSVVTVQSTLASEIQVQHVAPDERAVLAEVSDLPDTTSVHILNFKPTPGYSLDQLDSELQSRGWTIRSLVDVPADPNVEGDEGKKKGDFNSANPRAPGWAAYIAVRLPGKNQSKSSPFDMLNREGYRRT